MVHFRENFYNGVNAHLNSHLQTPGAEWAGFHSAYIVYLTEWLANNLPRGYFALNEKSLQLIETQGDGYRRSRTVADVGIYTSSQSAYRVESDVLTVASPASTIPLIETLTDEDYSSAVVIHYQEGDNSLRPVTRLELLSPANKPPGSHAQQYVDKRRETLYSGINLIEIDLLHEQKSPVKVLPSYVDRGADASPYLILVNNPHPSVDEGHTAVYPFFVDDPIPNVSVPLLLSETLVIPFGQVYNRTFAFNPFYGELVVDYTQEPVRFATYTSTDQERIHQRMELAAQ